MSTLITGATSWLATYLIQSTLLLLGALALVRWLRDPAARERVWKIALVAPLFTASLGWLLPASARPVLDLSPALRAGIVPAAEPAPPLAGAPASSVTMTTMVVNPRAPETEGVPVAVPREEPAKSIVVAPPRNWLGVAAVVLWLAGAGFLLTRRAVALRRLMARLASRRTVRKGAAHELLAELCADDELSARPRLTLADELSTPLVLGPGEICLPRRVAEDLPPRELAAILAHEVAHVRRRDLHWLRACALLECLLFAQPLNRLVRRRLLADAELLCDDWAGERTGARLELAQGLETVARWSRVVQRPLPLPCLGAERGALLARVERLLAEPIPSRRRPLLTAGLVTAVIALAGFGPTAQAPSGETPPDFATLSLDDLFTVQQQAGGLLDDRLLAPPDGWEQRYADDLALPGTRVVRLLQRDRQERMLKDGQGAYFSFETDDHDYQREPDLEYQGELLSSGFYGNSTGHVLDLGPVPLSELTAEGPPSGIDGVAAAIYQAMLDFSTASVPKGKDVQDALIAAVHADAQIPGRVRPIVDHGYLLRAILPDEHDDLIAFVVKEAGPDSVVLAGRVIKRWPVVRSSPIRKRREWPDLGTPAWMAKLDLAQLRALNQQLSDLLCGQLLAIPPELIPNATGVPGDNGVARLLWDGQYAYDRILTLPGGGAWFSFATGTHDSEQEPDVCARKHRQSLSSGLRGGDVGAFLDLGELPLASLDLSHPPALSDDARAAWDLLQRSSLPDTVRAMSDVRVTEGHSYLLRSIVEGHHDILVGLQVLARDERGLTLSWRILARYDTRR